MKAIVAVLGLAMLTAAPQRALAWGGDGHRIVAAIAIKLLPPEKAAALDNLLRGSQVDRDFVDAASYADEVIRNQDHSGKFSPWHYVDWPDGDVPYSPAVCKPDCIINQLPIQINSLRASADPEARALALSWVIHLMGDLHQPLHVTDRNDRGGNEFIVKYRNRTTCRGGQSETHPVRVELHSVWDTCVVVELESDRTPRQMADDLRAGLTTYKGQPSAEGDYMQWATEAHALAHQFAYGSLQNGADLEDPYIRTAAPVVQQQLLRAGIRLARVLDEKF